MTLHSFLLLLGDPIDGSTPESIYEAIFPLFAHRPPPKSLGFIDRKSTILSVTVNDREFKINQSPTLLGSQRERGTTGAVLWSITPPLATFLTSLTSPLAIHGIISPQSTILELGTGVSSIIGLSLAIAAPLNTRPARIILSDQEYVLKLARKNIEENLDAAGKWEKVRDDVKPTFASYKVSASPAGRKNTRESARFGRSAISKSRTNSGLATGTEPSSRHPGITIDVISLDWEEDSIWHHPAFSGRLRCPISLVLVVDCIYNESLIAPLIDTCIDACCLSFSSTTTISNTDEYSHASDTLVLIALELRSPDVTELFLEQFTKSFVVWRIPDRLLCEELRCGADDGGREIGSGYVLFCGVLKVDMIEIRKKWK